MASSACLLIVSFVIAGVFAYPLDNRQTNDTVEDSFRPVSLPTDFGSYDPDDNGYIDLEELAKVTGTSLDDARKPFMDADIDDDDQVSPSEFERAPWSLSVFNREDLIPEEEDEEGGEDDDEEEGVHAEDVIDDEEENIFDNADDILVDVSKLPTEDEETALDTSSVETMEEEKPEEPVEEEEDDESRNVDTDEDETDEEEDEEDDSDVVDPLLDDDLLREETVLSEDEFVENAIY